jgi:peptide/nickel transport system permease protein
MQAGFVVRRIGVFFLVIWAAASLLFFLPRLSGANPVRERLLEAVGQGGVQQGGMEEVVKAYEARFGLDQPLWKQYVRFLGDMARFDFGYSIGSFPNRVSDMVLRALPWSLVLLTVTTLIGFAVGTLLGAFLAWPRAPGSLQFLVAPLMIFSAVPYYLLGIVLIFVLAFTFRIFPLGGGYSIGTTPNFGLSFLWDAVRHSILPGLSIVVASIGFWALGMRGMMVTIQGEDYMLLGEVKGLKAGRLFLRYAMRNAILPQTTALALSLGQVISGAVLVEVVFGYPGVGTLLFRGIRQFDYFVIYGIVYLVIISIGLATLIIDLVYPLLDPRISYQRT